MAFESKLESAFFGADAPNRNSSSLRPSGCFVISYNRDGTVLSVYDDLIWDLSPYAGSLVRMTFDLDSAGGQTEIAEENRELHKRIVFYFLYGPRKPVSAATVYVLHDVISRVVKHCNNNGVLVSRLGRFEHVVESLAYEFTPSYARALPRLLTELFVARADLGFSIIDHAQIKLVRQKLPTAEVRQTAYIPQRVYQYQLAQCRAMLNDYLAHREAIERLFTSCLKSYVKAYGSVDACFDARADGKRGTRNGARNPFNPSGNQYVGKTFADLARTAGVAHILEKWLLVDGRTIDDANISLFGMYFSAVQFVGRAYLVNYSGMRIDEASCLRSSCLETDLDPLLGDIYMLRGETEKTIDDDNALWITSSDAAIAVEAMSSVSRMRISVATQNRRIPLTDRDRKDPRLVTRAYEPWGISVARSSDTSRTVHATYGSWTTRCPGLFDMDVLRITESDLSEAARMTPSLDFEQFKVGTPWPLAFHQLRRTLTCNAAGSGLVSLPALRSQMKHQHSTMTQYYGRNHSMLQLNESMRKDYSEAVADAVVSKAMLVLSSDFVSPFGAAHKAIKTEFLSTVDVKKLKLRAKQGKFSIRENALGVCLFDGYCPYGGIDNVAQCVNCDELLADRRKRERFIRLAEEIRCEISSAGHRDVDRSSLDSQYRAMRKVIDVVLV